MFIIQFPFGPKVPKFDNFIGNSNDQIQTSWCPVVYVAPPQTGLFSCLPHKKEEQWGWGWGTLPVKPKPTLSSRLPRPRYVSQRDNEKIEDYALFLCLLALGLYVWPVKSDPSVTLQDAEEFTPRPVSQSVKTKGLTLRSREDRSSGRRNPAVIEEDLRDCNFMS